MDGEGDCDGVAGFVLVGSCGVALGLVGVDGTVVVLVAEAVLSASVDFDFGLSFGVCVAEEVVVGDEAVGDASRLRRIVLMGSTLGSLPAIDSWTTCCSS